MKLLKDEELDWSSVVANCNMNRSRKLSGVNSYQNEIGIDIFDYLINRANQTPIRWLDLCCGEGKAIIDISQKIKEKDISNIELEGIDLVKMFDDYESLPFLNLKVQSLSNWIPNKEYDLITCIHGLHYIGNKLELIQKSICALKEGGIFIANLDLENIKSISGESLKKDLKQLFRKNKVDYDSRKRIIKCLGKREFEMRFNYLGANDKAGKNYTGQEVVDSYYEMKKVK